MGNAQPWRPPVYNLLKFLSILVEIVFFYKGAVSSLLAAYTIVYDLSKLSQKKKKKKRVTVRTRHRKATYDDIYFQMKIMS